MTSVRTTLMWALPACLVLLFTAGPYVMMGFALAVGIIQAVRNFRSTVAVVTAASLLAAMMSPLAACG